jgi:hypothetical protein
MRNTVYSQGEADIGVFIVAGILKIDRKNTDEKNNTEVSVFQYVFEI